MNDKQGGAVKNMKSWVVTKHTQIDIMQHLHGDTFFCLDSPVLTAEQSVTSASVKPLCVAF